MTTMRAPLTDAALRSALLELAAGPDAGQLTTDVLREVAVTPQARRLPWPVLVDRRRLVLVGAVALLTLALVGALIGSGVHVNRLLGNPDTPMSIVVQQWNGLRDPESVLTHTVFSADAPAGRPLGGAFPANAVGLRWSPDGDHVTYFTEEHPAGRRSNSLTALYVANSDGTNATRVVAASPMENYIATGFGYGVEWSPKGDRFLLWSSTHSCDGVDPNCIPPSTVEVYDRDGHLVATWSTPDNISDDAEWSPDGLAIGWMTGICVDGSCGSRTFNWRLVDGEGPVTSFTVNEQYGAVTWGDDGRLRAVLFVEDGSITRVYTMARDGTDIRDVPWDLDNPGGAAWSPNGQFLTAFDSAAATLTIGDLGAGTSTTASIPASYGYVGWSPDSEQILLSGEGEVIGEMTRNAYAVVDADGTGFRALGDGLDLGWMPAR